MEDGSTSRRSRFERWLFLLSVIFIGILYGFLATRAGWFPGPLFERALSQARELTSAPDFVAPRVYERSGVVTNISQQANPRPLLLVSRWKELDWNPGLKLIDRSGTTLHTWPVYLERIFSDSASREASGTHHSFRSRPVNGVHLFENGDVLFNVAYVGTVRMDACGNVRWKLLAGTHHSISPAGDGTFWIPATRAEPSLVTPNHPEGLRIFGRPVFQDQVLRVSSAGEVLASINVLDLLYQNGLERHIFRIPVDRADVTHLNDVEPLPDSLADEYRLFEAGDLLISLRNLHLVLVADPETREVRWHTSHPFTQQHDPDFIGEGWIGVFDNRRDGTARGTILGGSRIVAVHPPTDSTRILFSPNEPGAFYTDVSGRWQLLPDGHLLLTEATTGRIVELNREGESVWEWIHAPHDDSSYVPGVLAAQPEVSMDRIASWPCSPSG